jgi:hypothetical protein
MLSLGLLSDAAIAELLAVMARPIMTDTAKLDRLGVVLAMAELRHESLVRAKNKPVDKPVRRGVRRK